MLAGHQNFLGQFVRFAATLAAQEIVIDSAAPVTEVIRDEENGLLVDFFSSEGLVNEMCEVLEYPDRMLEIQRRARQIILERFNLRTVCLSRQTELIERLGH